MIDVRENCTRDHHWEIVNRERGKLIRKNVDKITQRNTYRDKVEVR